MAELDDAFGLILRTEYETGGVYEIVERDDGHVDATPASVYFTTYEEWSDPVQAAIDRAEGRVLDAGCGAGRHSLYLQEEGYEAVGLDVSDGALAVATDRGLERTLQRDIASLDEYEGAPFDTVCMFGNNFGLVGTRDRAPAVLEALAAATTPTTTILAQSLDPYETEDEHHLAYHRRNEELGRLAGTLRLRIRYKLAQSDWFDYLMASPEEMRSIAREAGWQLTETIESESGPVYVGVLTKADGRA